jgi:hypothetical protein
MKIRVLGFEAVLGLMNASIDRLAISSGNSWMRPSLLVRLLIKVILEENVRWWRAGVLDGFVGVIRHDGQFSSLSY